MSSPPTFSTAGTGAGTLLLLTDGETPLVLLFTAGVTPLLLLTEDGAALLDTEEAVLVARLLTEARVLIGGTGLRAGASPRSLSAGDTLLAGG